MGMPSKPSQTLSFIGHLPEAAASVFSKVIGRRISFLTVPSCRYWQFRRGAGSTRATDQDQWKTRCSRWWVIIQPWNKCLDTMLRETREHAQRAAMNPIFRWSVTHRRDSSKWDFTHVLLRQLRGIYSSNCCFLLLYVGDGWRMWWRESFAGFPPFSLW